MKSGKAAASNPLREELMSNSSFTLAATTMAAALLLTTWTGPAAHAASTDQTPPTAPHIVYSQGFFCFTLYIGAQRVTDNVTPEPEIRYEVFGNGQFIGLLDRGNSSAAWGNLKLNDEGPNRVFVEAVDAAGNRSRSGTNTVTGYDCEV
jgi:hypothetical protein